jgi:hypothetical protein
LGSKHPEDRRSARLTPPADAKPKARAKLIPTNSPGSICAVALARGMMGGPWSGQKSVGGRRQEQRWGTSLVPLRNRLNLQLL